MNITPLIDEDAQRLYLNAILSNPELFTSVQNILLPKYFDPHLAKGVKFIHEYFQEHRIIPNHHIFTTVTKLKTEIVDLLSQDLIFVSENIAEFCKLMASIDVIKRASCKDGFLDKQDYGTMLTELKAASEIGLLTDLGIDYFNDPLSRLETNEIADPVISTKWKSVDAVIGGGIGLQELIIFLAPSGGGKSVSMMNLSLNLLEQGYNGVYITLEMRDRKMALRLDQMIARMTTGLVNLNKVKVANDISKLHERSGANFFIKRMREETTTASDISVYLRQLTAAKKFTPTFVTVDYLDLLAPVKVINDSSMFLKDKYVSTELRAIGFDFNCIMISGAQLGKHTTEAINEGHKIHQGDVQGGSSKTNTSDLMIATVKTDAMHEKGEYRFEFPKARNSDAGTKQVTMGWDKNSLRIFDIGTELYLKKKDILEMPTVKYKHTILEELKKSRS